MTDETFWKKVRNRRNLFFYWWIGWLPFGAIGTAILRSRFGNNFPAGMILLFTWFIGWILIQIWLSSLRCPKCNKPAIGSALFFMKDAQCKRCGYSYSDWKKHHATKI